MTERVLEALAVRACGFTGRSLGNLRAVVPGGGGAAAWALVAQDLGYVGMTAKSVWFWGKAMSVVPAKQLSAPGSLGRIVRGVTDRVGVAPVIAKHAVRSAAVVREIWADEPVEQYEREMPIDAAVEWFVKNRKCSWIGTK